MSKQSEAKERQNYRTNPNCCSNCAHYKFDIVEKQYKAFDVLKTWHQTEEKNKRCTFGKFAVKKSAVCDMHKLKIEV